MGRIIPIGIMVNVAIANRRVIGKHNAQLLGGSWRRGGRRRMNRKEEDEFGQEKGKIHTLFRVRGKLLSELQNFLLTTFYNVHSIYIEDTITA